MNVIVERQKQPLLLILVVQHKKEDAWMMLDDVWMMLDDAWTMHGRCMDDDG